MKFFAATAALALAATAANAEVCDVGKLTVTLGPIITPAVSCQTASGFQVVPPTALPTADQVKAICTKCTDLITAAKAMTFPDCTFPIGGEQMAISAIFNKVAGQCDGAAASSNATTTAPAANATTESPAATTEAPSATTVAPAADKASSEAGSSEGSKASSDEVTAPASTTAKPSTTPAPTTSAGVSATLGAAVAVACSIAAFVL